MPLTLGSLQCKPPPNLDNPLTPTKRDFRMEFQQIRFNNILELPEEVVEEFQVVVVVMAGEDLRVLISRTRVEMVW